MNVAASHPEICFKSSISAMTVRIDPKMPATQNEIWFALPAWSVYVPLLAVAQAVPQALADGTLYRAGHPLLKSARFVRGGRYSPGSPWPWSEKPSNANSTPKPPCVHKASVPAWAPTLPNRPP